MNSEEFLGTDSDLDYQLLLNAKKLTIEKVLLRYLSYPVHFALFQVFM